MPLFYFRPFNFHPPKRPQIIEIDRSEIVLYVTISVVVILLFAALIVIPLVLILNESGAGF